MAVEEFDIIFSKYVLRIFIKVLINSEIYVGVMITQETAKVFSC